MSFQGFAREEGFSTHHINIDIGSVIDNDLAEASRMSKFMSKNTQMESKWGQMYLDALVNKHEVEKRNRERNFKFFMDNRANIQKQVEYNNQVKYEDAGREGPAPLSETIIPKLFDFAVKAGSKIIQQEVGKRKAAKEEALRAEKKETLQTMSGLALKGSKEQREAIKSGIFDENYRNASAAEQQKIREHFNSLGDYKASEKNVAAINRTNGLKDLDRELAEHSTRNTAIRFDEHQRNSIHNINGRDVGYHDLQHVNKQTLLEWQSRTEAGYIKSVSPDNGLTPGALDNIYTVTMQMQGRQAAQRDTQEYRQANQDNKEQIYHALDQRDTAGKIEYLFGANGFQAITGRGFNGAWDQIEEYFGQPGRPAAEIKEFYNAKTGPNGERLRDNPNSSRSIRFRQLIQKAHVNEAQALNNLKLSQETAGEQLLFSVKDMTQEEARNLVQTASSTETEFGKVMGELSNGLRKRIISTAMQQAGMDEGVQLVSTAIPSVDKAFNTSAQNSIIRQVALSTVQDKPGEPLVLESLKNPFKFQVALKTWLGKIKRDYDPEDQWTELQFQTFISKKLDDDNDSDIKQLKSYFTPTVQELDPETGKLVPAKKATWPNLEKAYKGSLKDASGISQISGILSNRSSRQAVSEITQDETVIEAITPWMLNLHKAQKAGADLNPMLARAPSALVLLAQRTKDGSVGQWANYFIRDHFTHMKPLGDDVILTQEEAKELNSRITGYTSMLESQQQFFKQNNTWRPASHVRPGDASIVAELDYRHAGHGLYNPDKAHGDWNIKVKDGTQADSNKATEFLYDVMNGLGIVATEVLGRDGVGNMHAPGSEHYLGNKMDVPFRGQTYSTSGPLTDADKALYHKNRKMADTILNLYNQGYTDPNQVIRMMKGEQPSTGVHGNYMPSNPRFR